MKSTLNKNIKRKLTIAILDEDNFYMAGLKMAITTLFKKKNIIADFILGYNATGVADIVFQAIRCGTCTIPYHQNHALGDKPHYYFAIVDAQNFHLQHLYRDIKENLIYRHQSVDEITQIIESKVFFKKRSPEKIGFSQIAFLRELLTQREHEVLCHLQQGKTPTDIAIHMGINLKTISVHKRAAMKKLNFRRTSELFHWMLKGGLSQR